jgi:hypothetical protein
MKKTFCFLIGCVLAAGCHAGWLQSGGGGITIQNFGDGSGLTGRVGQIEADVASLKAELSVQSGGRTWTAGADARNWTGVALSGDGRRQVAVVENGLIYVSSDYGVCWSGVADVREWRGVAMSRDGAYATACAFGGMLNFSSDYGATWTARGDTRDWEAVAISADGMYQTALVEFGAIYLSTNRGVTWRGKLDGEVRHWVSIGMSSNGEYQTAAAHPEDEQNSGLYVSSDFGSTWIERESGPKWMSVAVSGDGARQLACATAGKLFVSRDYGNTWLPKEQVRSWVAVGMSADGRLQFAQARNMPILMSTDYGETWTSSGSSAQWYWHGVVVSADGGYGLAGLYGGQLMMTRPSVTARGDLVAAYGVGLGSVGQFMIRGGTQLVFVAGGVVNVLDNDVLHP